VTVHGPRLGGAQLAEQGTHAELVAAGGKYARFVQQLNREMESAAASAAAALPQPELMS
jgi:hypothetical protein